MKHTIQTIVLLIIATSAMASTRISRSDYIDKWKDEAIYQMVVNKIPASITLAQGILESGDGNSTLASIHNNHFGIKCHSTWTGGKTYHDDDKKGECFRVYEDAYHSFDDHSDFLLKKRYAGLFDLKISDYKGWAKGLKKCGYATHPKYAHRLIQIIEANNLEVYDDEGKKFIKRNKVPERMFYGEPFKDDFLADNVNEDEKKPSGKSKNRVAHDDDLPNVTIKMDRTLKLSKNNIKFILAKDGDTFESISEDLDMMPWQIRKYNDLAKGADLSEGELIYIQPKRNMAKEKWHTVVEGESMRDISQRFGIKLKKIYRKNNMTRGSEPIVGQKLSLRTRVSVSS